MAGPLSFVRIDWLFLLLLGAALSIVIIVAVASIWEDLEWYSRLFGCCIAGIVFGCFTIFLTWGTGISYNDYIEAYTEEKYHIEKTMEVYTHSIEDITYYNNQAEEINKGLEIMKNAYTNPFLKRGYVEEIKDLEPIKMIEDDDVWKK